MRVERLTIYNMDGCPFDPARQVRKESVRAFNLKGNRLAVYHHTNFSPPLWLIDYPVEYTKPLKPRCKYLAQNQF